MWKETSTIPKRSVSSYFNLYIVKKYKPKFSLDTELRVLINNEINSNFYRQCSAKTKCGPQVPDPYQAIAKVLPLLQSVVLIKFSMIVCLFDDYMKNIDTERVQRNFIKCLDK